MFISPAIEAALEAIGGSVLVVAMLGSIVSTWIAVRLRNDYGKDLENHKAGLQQALEVHKTTLVHENEIAVERLRSELSVVAIEHEVRYRRLHSDMASKLADTYANLAYLYGAAADYVRMFEFEGDAPREVRRKKFHEVMNKTRKDFLTQRIFFPATTADRTQQFIDALWRKVIKFQLWVDAPPDQQSWSQTHETWHEVSEWVENEVPPLLAAIEDDFRRLLGHEAPDLAPHVDGDDLDGSNESTDSEMG